MRAYLNPYGTMPEMREALTPAQLAARWSSFLTALRAGLAALPVSSVQVVDSGFSGVRVVLTSEDAIRAAVSDCTLAKGIAFASADQLQCWLEAAARNVAQIGAYLAQMRNLAERFAAAVYPATVTEPALQKLRASQLQFLDLSRRAIQAVESSLAGWAKLLEGGRTTVASMRSYLANIESIQGTPEYDAWKAEGQKDALQLLNKVYLPFVDVSLYELAAAKRLAEIATEALGKMAELAQFVPAYHDTLKQYIDHLSQSHREGGVLDGILRFLFGAEPGKKIAMLVIGTIAAVGLVFGTIFLVRKALARKT